MKRGEGFNKKGEGKKNHCSIMSNFAWSDLNTKGTLKKLHDSCPKSNCQK